MCLSPVHHELRHIMRRAMMHAVARLCNFNLENFRGTCPELMADARPCRHPAAPLTIYRPLCVNF